MIKIYDTPDAYICERCGRTLNECETELAHDDTLECCKCGGEAIPAYRCEVCGEIVPEDVIHGYEHNVCWDCIQKKRYDVDFCANVGDDDEDLRGLNGFLSKFFSNSEINEMMLQALKERAKFKPIDSDGFLKLRANDAADLLAAEVKNG